MTQFSRHLAAAMAVSVVLAGCTEYASIRTGPPGAVVTVNGKAAGKTPLQYGVPRSELDDPHEVRIELAGYEPATATLQTRLAKGRVTGAVFTLGLLAVFRSMHYIEPIFVQLTPLESPAASDDRGVGETLRNLRDLHKRGKISDEELQRRTNELLKP